MRYDGHFRLAHELKKNLNEVMGWNGPLTHRQFMCWSFWLHRQWNKPTRDNYYAMQIACEIKRSGAKNPGKIQIKDQKIPFETVKEENKEEQDAEKRKKQIEMTKAIFMGFMTAPVTVIENGKVVDTIEPPLVKRKRLIEEQNKQRKEALAKARNAMKEKETPKRRRV